MKRLALIFAVIALFCAPSFADLVKDSNGRTVSCTGFGNPISGLTCNLSVPAGLTNAVIVIPLDTYLAVTGLTFTVGAGTSVTEVGSSASSSGFSATRHACYGLGSTSGTIAVSTAWTSGTTYGVMTPFLVSGGTSQSTPCAHGNSAGNYNTAPSITITCTTSDLAIEILTVNSGSVLGIPNSGQTIIRRGNQNQSFGITYKVGTNPTLGWPLSAATNSYWAESGSCITGAGAVTPDSVVHLLALGDSIMEGHNISNPPGYIGPNDGGPSGSTNNDINTQVHANNAGYTASNYGVSGAHILQIFGELNTAIDNGEHFTKAIWEGGINNISDGGAAGAAFSTTQTYYDQAVAIITALGAKIIFQEVWPSGLDTSTVNGTRTSSKQWNVDLSTYVSNNSTVAQLLLMFVRMGTGNNLNATYDSGDGTHPNAAGVTANALAILGAVAPSGIPGALSLLGVGP